MLTEFETQACICASPTVGYHLKANVLKRPREKSLAVKTPDRLCFGVTRF